jgi:serine protease Do
VLVALAAALVLSACGGSGGDDAPPAKAPSDPAGTSEPAVSLGSKSSAGAVTSVEDAKSATIQIEALGSFVDPQVGSMLNAAGRGSGFIIDPSGLAVTNNHVVSGAALIKVWVGGEAEELNAKVLGVSECSDLAVIDIEGDGFPFLTWSQGPVKVGTDIYVAGFPLGDPEYTLTRGVISKERADGNMSQAAVDSTVEYDATTNPGNSGGPVINEDGQVVAVHFAGSGSTRQAFGVAGELAQSVTEQLADGKDLDSIGIGGQAVSSEDGSVVGVWVSAVTSGSPADKAGIEPGDIITRLENVVVGTDGTMSDYCDIIRGHDASDTLAVEVLRFSTGEILGGQLNGDPLSTEFVFDPSVPSPDDPAAPVGEGYVDVADAYSSIAVEIPEAWADTDGSEWMDGNDVIGASISAAPDLDAYNRTWDAPGMFFGVSDDLALLGGHVQILDAVRPDYLGDCKLDSRSDYNDGYYRGKADLFYNCGGPGGSQTLVLSAVPTDNSQAFTILLIVQMVNPEDEDIAIHALDTFRVIGTLP